MLGDSTLESLIPKTAVEGQIQMRSFIHHRWNVTSQRGCHLALIFMGRPNTP